MTPCGALITSLHISWHVMVETKIFRKTFRPWLFTSKRLGVKPEMHYKNLETATDSPGRLAVTGRTVTFVIFLQYRSQSDFSDDFLNL